MVTFNPAVDQNASCTSTEAILNSVVAAIPPLPRPLATAARDLVFPSLYRGQEQQLLLDVRPEVQEVHDLRDPGARHASLPCQLGIVGHFAIGHHLVEPDRQKFAGPSSCVASMLRRHGNHGRLT
jgi:hypothetical protein